MATVISCSRKMVCVKPVKLLKTVLKVVFELKLHIYTGKETVPATFYSFTKSKINKAGLKVACCLYIPVWLQFMRITDLQQACLTVIHYYRCRGKHLLPVTVILPNLSLARIPALGYVT